MISEQSVKNHLTKRFTAKDPWHFETSEYEKNRFTTMLELNKLVAHDTILEVGCAEGHFTKMLTTICDHVDGLDIIPVAIERAKERAPKAKYFLGSIETFSAPKKYDVLNCSETIYYCPDKKKALDNMQKLAKYIVVSDNILNGWHPNTADRYFWRFPLVTLRVVVSWKEKKVCLISLRKLTTE